MQEVKTVADAVGFNQRDTKYERRTTLKLIRFEETGSLSYYFIGSIGKKTEAIATILFEVMIKLIYRKEDRVLMAIDDSPTTRYGPEVHRKKMYRTPLISQISQEKR